MSCVFTVRAKLSPSLETYALKMIIPTTDLRRIEKVLRILRQLKWVLLLISWFIVCLCISGLTYQSVVNEQNNFMIQKQLSRNFFWHLKFIWLLCLPFLFGGRGGNVRCSITLLGVLFLK